ncbi:hypothetical protein [Rhizobium sp. FY34]|uniref:hypothetical protein n=1 Tax=Rhizobium sp. FY34 TaxID=2562309 RepID=UPI0010BFD9A4|nr:hypothetical protein [Rhizobium sp. FY34]
MMLDHSAAERAALDKMEPIWSAQGYRVVREPGLEDIPDFLGKYRPDALAVGKQPGLVVEVINPLNPSNNTKIKQLQSLFAGRPDWTLEVLYLASDQTSITPTPNSEIRQTLDTVGQLAEIDPRAGLMLAWASLEAIGRALDPGSAGKTISARALIDLLVSQGYIKQHDGGSLRKFADMRNKLTHGQLELMPTLDDVRELVTLAKSIPLPDKSFQAVAGLAR